MKNLLQIIILLVLTFIQGVSQSYSFLLKTQGMYEWNTISEIPNGLNVIYFIDSTNGWVIGDEGKILATEDGGVSWFPQNSGTTNRLTSIYFINNENGFACGYNRTLIYTNDKGNTWSPIQLDSTVGSIYSSLGTDPDDNLYIISNYGEIFFSNDSGKIWANIYNFNDWGFTYIDYSNYPICFAKRFGFGVFFRSPDGGNSWEELNTPTRFDGDFCLLNAKTGWVTENWAPSSSYHDSASIFITIDSGRTWDRQTTIEGICINNIVFVDSLEGWSSSYTLRRHTIFHTSDGGQSWVSQFDFEIDSLGVINDIFFLDNQTGWALTNRDKIIKYGKSNLVSIDKYENIFKNEFVLNQNYPNPFNPATTISYYLPKSGFVILKIYDIQGKEIRTLINELQKSGRYSVNFNASDLSSGVYLYK